MIRHGVLLNPSDLAAGAVYGQMAYDNRSGGASVTAMDGDRGLHAGPQEKLDSTAISQPAIYVASLAAIEKLRAEAGDVSICMRQFA